MSTKPTKPTVIGLYGLPGTGKTTIIQQLQAHDNFKNDFQFYDGSVVLASLLPGGLEAFKALPAAEKTRIREQAIRKISDECVQHRAVGVVAGHCMFWSEDQDVGDWIMTDADLDVYTHILYLDVPTNVIAERCLKDNSRTREIPSPLHMVKWQHEEKERLRKECREHNALLSILRSETQGLGLKALEQTSRSLLDFKAHGEGVNLKRAESCLDEIMDGQDLETMMVIDGDRTLAVEDTGPMFFKTAEQLLGHPIDGTDPLKTLFSSKLKYSYTAFRQAALMYEDIAYELGDESSFDQICEKVAHEITLRPEFQSLMRVAAGSKHTGAVVVTCGLGLIWEMVLEKAGLNDQVRVIGGGRLQNGFVVTAAVKGALVSRLQEEHHVSVWAFGDSPLDLDMLRKANEAVVVVGKPEIRSKSMESELTEAIDAGEIQAQQMLFPREVPPRLDLVKLPSIESAEIEALIGHTFLTHATDTPAAKLLMTATRDASIQGPALQEAHRRVGRHLATMYMTDILGLEEYLIPHVQTGKSAAGHRLYHEDQTLVVALMRGGLPMAEGVNEVFPHAGILHAKEPEHLTAQNLARRAAVVLVDGVINEGRTVEKFVEHVRKLNRHVRIVVVAGVVQAQSIGQHGPLRQLARRHSRLNVIALRVSENKYTGIGTTDTGNRLFNSTHLE